jgi:hypothetical protein
VIILVLWVTLARLSLTSQLAALWLAIGGAVIALTGLLWLYKVGAEEGVERLSFLNVTPRGLVAGAIFLLIELAMMPVFSIVITLFYFDRAWKPFLIEILGIGMCTSGIILLLR